MYNLEKGIYIDYNGNIKDIPEDIIDYLFVYDEENDKFIDNGKAKYLKYTISKSLLRLPLNSIKQICVRTSTKALNEIESHYIGIQYLHR